MQHRASNDWCRHVHRVLFEAPIWRIDLSVERVALSSQRSVREAVLLFINFK
jgi:hypothetical protein